MSIFQALGFLEADLSNACLKEVATASVLWDADFTAATLVGSDFSFAYLDRCRFVLTNLADANLTNTALYGTVFYRASLDRTVFMKAWLGDTLFSDVDLSQVVGLEAVNHARPSSVGADSLALSKGRIPDIFLRGCGLSDWETLNAKLYDPDLTPVQIADIQAEVFRLRSASPIQINPLFISYSHKDTPFVEALERLLDDKGIRYWRDVHDLKAGRVERQLERAISLNPTVLIILSKESVESDWVEWEVSKGRELEKKSGRDVLCPVALDDSWKTCSWPGPLRRQIEDYHVLDFRDWKDHAVFNRQFSKLIDGLNLFYQK